MFDIAWSEFLVVAVVALVVVGPKDLPALLRNVGRMVATVRRMAGEFQTQFNDAMREAELDDLKREVSGLKDIASKATSSPNPFQIARDEIRKAVDAKPAAPSALAGEAAASSLVDDQPIPSALAPAPTNDDAETGPDVVASGLSGIETPAGPNGAGPHTPGPDAAGPVDAEPAHAPSPAPAEPPHSSSAAS
ncbi:Sec-independent protein translocase protein TatB [Methylopila sp. Yamaguchi]|uniref:Sec-independent protein translocase protein TatB n=1 Tax=Methylopila sp. Yamaguchi TaxID=1437817 RepID=UPI000CC5AEEC|nr:Sec-independent protein translocase protein TatB [Methylopila sp. Yamaguchi]GBD47954.1 twin-arginine translocation protein subunit TatB [Methylopila sp. Yamaguchi]